MATKIYISGKISGIENEAPELFAKAETELQAKGFETVNPITLNHQAIVTGKQIGRAHV